MRILLLLTILVAGCLDAPQPAETPATPPEVVSYDIYLVAYDTTLVGGQEIGCGDVLVPIEQTSALRDTPLAEALRALVQAQDASVIVNTVRGLTVEEVTIEKGVATVQLAGRLELGGVCDHPRVEGQLRQTALQFPEVDSVLFFIDGEPLDAYLSLR